MSTETLPRTLDVRKAAVRGLHLSGTLDPVDLPRFRPLLAADRGSVAVALVFSRDEENRYLVRVSLTADVTVLCQRCLQPMPLGLSATGTLAAVWTDEQAAHLPRHLDPLIADTQDCNLWHLAEDELILAMPAFSYHDTEDCKQRMTDFTDPPPEQVEDTEETPNPFKVLAQLKPGNEH